MYRKLTFASLVVLGLVLAGGTVFALSRSSTPMIPQTDIAIGLMTEEFPVGDGPTAILSADTHIWVSNFTAGTVTKLRASDGATLGTFKFGNISGLAFDGVTLWTSSLITGVVTRIRPADGFVLGSTVVGADPQYIAIDSEEGVWVSNFLSDDVTKLFPAGIVLGTFAVGNQPRRHSLRWGQHLGGQLPGQHRDEAEPQHRGHFGHLLRGAPGVRIRRPCLRRGERLGGQRRR